MSVDVLVREFDRIGDTPKAVVRLRSFVLDLAVSGKLVVPQSSPGNLLASDLPWAVPQTWTVSQLSDLAGPEGIFIDGDWVESKDQDPDGDVRLTQLADVGSGLFRDRSSRFMRPDVAARLNCTYLQSGDVLIARMPDPIGRACIFPGADRPCVTVVDVAILRSKRTDVCSPYVVAALNSRLFSAMVQTKAAGTTRQRISRGNLGRLPFPLPPLEEQQRIIARVDELMALCDQLEAAQLEREAQRDALRSVSLYQLIGIDQGEVTKASVQFFLDFLPRLTTKPEHLTELRRAIFDLGVKGMLLPQHYGRPPSEDACTEVTGVEGPFDLPPGWHWSTVAQLGSARLGKMLDKAKNKGAPRRYLRNVNVRWFDFDLSDLNLMPFEDRELEQFALRPGDVLICEGGEAGRAAVWDGREADVYFQKALHRVRLHEEVLPQFFVYYLRASADAGRLASYSTGATFMHLTGQLLASLPIPVPPKEEQERILHKIDELTSLCDELESALASEEVERARLLESLLHEALNGNSEPLPFAETELAKHSAQ